MEDTFKKQLDHLKGLLYSSPSLAVDGAKLSENGGDPFSEIEAVLVKRDLAKTSCHFGQFVDEGDNRDYWQHKFKGKYLVCNPPDHGVVDVHGLNVPFEEYDRVLQPGAIVKMSVVITTFSMVNKEDKKETVFAKLEPIQIKGVNEGEAIRGLSVGKRILL